MHWGALAYDPAATRRPMRAEVPHPADNSCAQKFTQSPAPTHMGPLFSLRILITAIVVNERATVNTQNN